MKYSKPSNTSVTATINNLLVMALAILTIACGKKESDAATESNTLTAFVYLNLTYKIEGDKITITGCNKKIADTLTIPETIGGNPVTSIGDNAFGDYVSLTSITIPNSVTSIGLEAFYNCISLESITIPDSVTSVGDDAFARCSSLKSITIPDSVKSIGGGVFGGCTSLTSITIPNSVTSIGPYAFAGCTSLTSITIPDGVASIGNSAFSECTNLREIIFLGNAADFRRVFGRTYENVPTIYRNPDAKGWANTLAGRPVKLITEKP